jgi:hypothetical protein
MWYVFTVFDYNWKKPRPLISVAVGDEETYFYEFYLANTGMTIKQIWGNIDAFKSVFNGSVICNDFKAHIQAFGLEKHVNYDVYDVQTDIPIADVNVMKKNLLKLVIEHKSKPPGIWQKVFANSSVVYQHLQDVGVYEGYKRVPVVYSQETFAGRSKTLGYSLQGTTDQNAIHSPELKHAYQIQFDWVAADLRMAAHMSKDENMIESFLTSDPYSAMSESLGIPRDECKKHFLKAVYSLNTNSPILECYPQFRDWMCRRIQRMKDGKDLYSLLGRPFRKTEKHDELAVFNAQFQGSVANAMQLVLIKLFPDYSSYILTETHDSIVLSCQESMISQLIKVTRPIMMNPFDGYVENGPRMPIKVSIGKEWRKWQHFKTYR